MFKYERVLGQNRLWAWRIRRSRDDLPLIPVAKRSHRLDRAEEDFYVSLPAELSLIADAGFPHPDCFWREGLIAVYGAFKNG
jgi:hypothetical protein